MGDSSLIYHEKLKLALQESEIHLQRLDIAFDELKNAILFPSNCRSF
jgi:hypothetical protein